MGYTMKLYINKEPVGTGEMAQWLRTHTSIEEDQTLAPSTHVRHLRITCNSIPKESNTSNLWPLQASILMYACAHMCKHTH